MSIDAIVIVIASYVVGSIPIAWLAGRVSGVELRERGSGNIGASNVWQSASRLLVVPVGLAQIAQGAFGPCVALLAGQGEGVAVVAGLAGLIGNNWNPWLRWAGGRGVGQAIGILLVLSPVGLGAFVVCALIGVVARRIPRFVAVGLVASGLAAAISGAAPVVVAGSGAVTAIVLLKRVLGNGAPDPSLPRPGVWVTRLLDDRDIADREAWVRRGRLNEVAKPDA